VSSAGHDKAASALPGAEYLISAEYLPSELEGRE